MTALNWVRVDANLHSNHKVLSLLSERGGDHAVCVYVFSLGYAGSHGVAGFIPKAALGLFHGKARDAAFLVAAGMWEEIPGGWQIHDWADYQPTDQESQARSEKARNAAAVRWAKQKKKEVTE